jgi:alpha-ketoglutarate-dependent taurine dioxygenase
MAVARPEVSTQPLGGSFGRAIEPAPEAPRLGDLDGEEVGRLCRRHGALLFRGFGATREEFVALSERSSRGFSTYQGGFFRDRQPVGAAGTLLTVTGSQEGFAIPLHGEMYYTGRRPGVLWFYASGRRRRAARRRSATARRSAPP